MEHEEDQERLAIKLMRDEESWIRELLLRKNFNVSEQDIIAVKSAATLKGHKEVDNDFGVPIVCCPGLADEVRAARERVSRALVLLTHSHFCHTVVSCCLF